ncbi:hypothetical protein SDC9_169425 [bioreactor metagenome]|uniref:Putative regulatory protein FmdB zinc ribbon domain-containing protein n=1 Tax=bioreactor metagenome TaxID=1076179 RepID=A0A645G7U6_9ZZZZ|nr:zinc ribbon domain-containing protein [Oscillospiraceae bacterium]
MPIYDLKCGKCGKEFDKLASVSEMTGKLIICPECGSNNLTVCIKKAPGIIMKSSSSVSECPNRHICKDGCCHGGH